MHYVLPSTLSATTQFLQQVFLYSSAMHCFDQPIRTILSFIPGNVIALKGDFWTEVQSELRHVPATCLAFMLSMIIWCCSTQSNWQPQFLRVQISRREVPEPEQNRCLKGRNLDLIFLIELRNLSKKKI